MPGSRHPGDAEIHDPMRMPQRFSKSTLIAVCLAAMFGVTAASGHQPPQVRHAMGGCPSHLDYVVLASLADSGNWVGLSTYRSNEHIDWQFSPTIGVQKVAYDVDRVDDRSHCR
jgi:hypothetical protein